LAEGSKAFALAFALPFEPFMYWPASGSAQAFTFALAAVRSPTDLQALRPTFLGVGLAL